MNRRTTAILLISAALLLGSCDVLQPLVGRDEGSTSPPATATDPAPTLGGSTTTAATAEPGQASASEAAEDEELLLTVWTTNPVVPTGNSPGAEALTEQLATFDNSHPDLQVEIYQKASRGEGSIIEYLRTAPPVAPAVIPDLALMDHDTLVQAVDEDLVVPLDDLVDPATLEGIYPAALDLATVDGSLVGIPFIVQTQHLVYRETLFEEPPNSFERIIGSPVPYVFPAGTLGSINRTVLTQYMAAGGTFVDDEGALYLDGDVLTRILTYYADARSEEIIDLSLFQVTDIQASWDLYVGRQAGLSTVSSSIFLAEQDDVRLTGTTWIPTPEGESYALVTGWMWVVTTTTPERQQAVMSLLNFLMNPVNQGGYAQSAALLPSQSNALAVWGDENEEYITFVDTLLQAAAPMPVLEQRASVGAAIQAALEDVLLNGVAPVQAANQAVQSVSPNGGDDS